MYLEMGQQNNSIDMGKVARLINKFGRVCQQFFQNINQMGNDFFLESDGRIYGFTLIGPVVEF